MTLRLIQRLGWKRALLLLALIIGVFAWWIAPHLTHKETTLQISATQAGLATPDGFFVYQKLDEHGISIKSITPDSNGLLVHLAKPEQQEEAMQVLQSVLPRGYSIAYKTHRRSLFQSSESDVKDPPRQARLNS
ncbi:modulator protein [Hafnia paralvei]|uniref:EnvZ/OmpR regulon moderator MzrA n=1 Tax=Hafnia paralvei TaxID=546367 RepID=UPI0009007319|nr:EnvZ/OmpR regulon moderator MzrA [Hafnia paralvei]AMH20152.2 modulator protein [Hafnia paralvei]